MTDPIRSELGWATPDRVVVRGYDLPTELLGEVGLGDMAFLELRGRLPDRDESAVLNALLVCLVEHGLTPSALATRFTQHGAPESLQGAVAAGLLGLGDRFVGSTEGAARIVQEAWAGASADDTVDTLAEAVVTAHLDARRIIPGLGHPLHQPIDPRTPRLFAIAAEHGFAGRHVELMQRIAVVAADRIGKPLLINATGAIGPIAVELGIDWQAARGLGVMARAVGLVGHVLEERATPIAAELWRRVEDEASAPHRS